MRQVNGDMDDLFRRASDRYPLRTDSADWDRLANALDHEPEPPSDRGEDKRRRRGVFWWFLLLPLGGLGYLAWHSNAQHTVQKGNIAAVQTAGAARQGVTVAARPAGAASGTEAAAPAGAAGSAGTDGSVGAAGAKGAPDAGGVARSAGGVRPAGVTGSAAVESAGANGPAGETRSAGETGRVNVPVVARPGRVAGRGTGFAGTSVAGSTEVGSGKTGSAGARSTEVTGTRSAGAVGTGATGTGSTGVTGSGTTGATGSATMTGNAARELLLSALDLRRVPTAGEYDLQVNVKAPGHAADSLPRAPKKGTSPSKTSHGYIGIFGAPDFSTVKFQQMKGVGTTFGVLLGYSFNDRWAVESGVYLDRKRYYTEGEYFNTKNVTTNYNTLLNVDGTCNMWEIPLNVRYNFNTSERMKWFATAGLSTYLMSNENYMYQAQPWPGGPVKEGYWNINKPSQYFFSVVNLSAGFEQRIGKIGSLRLEPYVRLPLSGIGTGRLPIMSAGLNIGITRRLW